MGQNRILVWAAVVLLFIASMLGGYKYWLRYGDFRSGLDAGNKHTVFYKDLSFENMHLKGLESEFSLRNGKVFRDGALLDDTSPEAQRAVRLALFYQWNKEDPILFAPDAETGKIKEAIDRLKEQEDLLLKNANEEKRLFPLDFLVDFMSTSDQYKKTTTDLSEENAQSLLALLLQAQQAYKYGAESAYNSFQEISSDPLANKKIAFLGGETTADINLIMSDFEKIKRNSAKLGLELEARAACLNDSITVCRRPLAGLTFPSKSFSEVPLLERAFPMEMLDLAPGESFRGPYLVNSGCWAKRDQQYLYVSQRNAQAIGYRFEWSILADKLYFSRTEGKTQVSMLAKERGLPLIVQASTAPYGCNDLGYKQELATIDAFYSSFKDESLYAGESAQTGNGKINAKLKSLWLAGAETENAFFGAQYPSEDALEHLAQVYAFTYAVLSKNEIGSPEQRNAFLERYILAKEKMYNFDLLLNRTTFHLFNFNGTYDDTKKVSPVYIYPARSNYSVLFLEFSNFNWRSEEKLQFFYPSQEGGEALLPNSGYIVDYENALKEYSEQDLREMVAKSEQFRKEIGERD